MAGTPPSPAARAEQDRHLPIANVGRIMKRSLPPTAKISKEAKETVQECVSEFISFVTGEASDKCQREKRKTINGDDLLWAMTTLGFDNYVSPLKLYLARYRNVEGDRSAAAAGEGDPPEPGNGGFDAGFFPLAVREAAEGGGGGRGGGGRSISAYHGAPW